jgi:hypothetical protein
VRGISCTDASTMTVFESSRKRARKRGINIGFTSTALMAARGNRVRRRRVIDPSQAPTSMTDVNVFSPAMRASTAHVRA